jgi:hypothetical protein
LILEFGCLINFVKILLKNTLSKIFQNYKNALRNRVARWFVFKTKSPILEGLAMGNLGIFYDPLVYFKAIGNS